MTKHPAWPTIDEASVRTPYRARSFGRLSISARLYGGGGLVVALFILLEVLSLWQRIRTSEGVEALDRMADLATRHLEADMMHDAIRGDVLSAALAEDAEQWAAASAAVEEHTARFMSAIQRMSDLAGEGARGTELRAQVSQVRADLTAYSDAAHKIIQVARVDREGARRQLPAFAKAFEAMEVSMEETAALFDAQQNDTRDAVTAMLFNGAALVSGILLLAAIVTAVGAVVVAQSILSPIRYVVDGIEQVSRKDYTVRLNMDGADEIARVSQLLDHAVGTTAGAIGSLRDAAHDLVEGAQSVATTTRRVQNEVETAASSTENASRELENVNQVIQSVARGVDEMGSAIRDVARSASQASRVASNAVQAADRTTSTVARLGESSVEIGKVLRVINAIAEQTNLLALNATIEAARAGEAGRGFAIVANEVKELARETARATQNISRQIETIQNDVQTAVSAIGEIGGIIHQISEHQSTIASAVEEQTATAAEISRHVSDAANASSSISRDMSMVATTSRDTSAAVATFEQAAARLVDLGERLTSLSAQFRT